MNRFDLIFAELGKTKQTAINYLGATRKGG
jgi:hypothetical protein